MSDVQAAAGKADPRQRYEAGAAKAILKSGDGRVPVSCGMVRRLFLTGIRSSARTACTSLR